MNQPENNSKINVVADRYKTTSAPTSPKKLPVRTVSPAPVEIGGQPGPEPTRFGDWEKNGRCTDF